MHGPPEADTSLRRSPIPLDEPETIPPEMFERPGGVETLCRRPKHYLPRGILGVAKLPRVQLAEMLFEVYALHDVRRRERRNGTRNCEEQQLRRKCHIGFGHTCEDIVEQIYLAIRGLG